MARPGPVGRARIPSEAENGVAHDTTSDGDDTDGVEGAATEPAAHGPSPGRAGAAAPEPPRAKIDAVPAVHDCLGLAIRR